MKNTQPYIEILRSIWVRWLLKDQLQAHLKLLLKIVKNLYLSLDSFWLSNNFSIVCNFLTWNIYINYQIRLSDISNLKLSIRLNRIRI